MQKSKWPLPKSVNARVCWTRETNGKPIAQIAREPGIFSREDPIMRRGIVRHGDCSFPLSIKRCFTALACTATRTATPTINSVHWRYAVNARPRNEARGGRQRTLANPLERFPYALPSITLQTSQAMIEAARDISFL